MLYACSTAPPHNARFTVVLYHDSKPAVILTLHRYQAVAALREIPQTHIPIERIGRRLGQDAPKSWDRAIRVVCILTAFDFVWSVYEESCACVDMFEPVKIGTCETRPAT